MSEFYEAEHRAHGVDLRTETGVDEILGDTRVSGVKLADGSEIACQMVIVGIGIVPAVGALITAGAAGGNGIDVDKFCRTSLDHVYAIGDCAAHANGFAEGAVIRLESVQNANDQAACAVKAILGNPEPYKATPWFWSNQYDLKLQTVGLSSGHDATVLRGDPAQRSFSVLYLKGGKLIAIDAVNAMKDYVQARKLVQEGAVTRHDLAPTRSSAHPRLEANPLAPTLPKSRRRTVKIGPSAFARPLLRSKFRRSDLRYVRFWAATSSTMTCAKQLSP